MTELNNEFIEEVNGGLAPIAIGLWGIFIAGYGSDSFEKIGEELGRGLYDGLNQ